MKDYLSAVGLLPPELSRLLQRIPEVKMHSVSEICLRSNSPIALTVQGKALYPHSDGRLSELSGVGAVFVSQTELESTVATLCRYSVHSFAQSINNGYIPLPHGHRAGICGTATAAAGVITAVRSFSSVNIRIAREHRGCAKPLYSVLAQGRGLLLIGAPLSGKTSLLRDICRALSEGKCGEIRKLSVVDERGEIAAENGNGQEPRVNTDILSLYPKGAGIDIAVRCLSPDIVILDEIGSDAEVTEILRGVNSGVEFIASAHGYSLEDVMLRPQLCRLIECGVFSYAVELEGKKAPGIVKRIKEINARGVKE